MKDDAGSEDVWQKAKSPCANTAHTRPRWTGSPILSQRSRFFIEAD